MICSPHKTFRVLFRRARLILITLLLNNFARAEIRPGFRPNVRPRFVSALSPAPATSARSSLGGPSDGSETKYNYSATPRPPSRLPGTTKSFRGTPFVRLNSGQTDPSKRITYETVLQLHKTVHPTFVFSTCLRFRYYYYYYSFRSKCFGTIGPLFDCNFVPTVSAAEYDCITNYANDACTLSFRIERARKLTDRSRVRGKYECAFLESNDDSYLTSNSPQFDYNIIEHAADSGSPYFWKTSETRRRSRFHLTKPERKMIRFAARRTHLRELLNYTVTLRNRRIMPITVVWKLKRKTRILSGASRRTTGLLKPFYNARLHNLKFRRKSYLLIFHPTSPPTISSTFFINNSLISFIINVLIASNQLNLMDYISCNINCRNPLQKRVMSSSSPYIYSNW